MIAAAHRWTTAEFLAWEERQPLRYEFDGTRPVAMTGGTAAHDRIRVNLIAALANRLRGSRCSPHAGDLKVQAGGNVRYPDAFVTCRPIDRRATIAAEPVIIFEILSASTAVVDRVVKNEEYRSIPSVQRYVMLEQERRAATVFERQGVDWVGHLLANEATIDLTEIGCAIPLMELYDGIDFAEDAEGDGDLPTG